MIICPECNGEKTKEYTCPVCDGSGEGFADGSRCQLCPRSEGVVKGICDFCDGKGEIPENEI